MTSTGQLNAQIPVELATGRYSLVIRSVDQKVAASSTNITLAKYAPGILTLGGTNQAAVFHEDGTPVSRDSPAHRDEPLTLYATGLGPTKGGKAVSGNASPSSPLAETDTVTLFFGDPRYKEAEIIVDWSGLAPGLVGVYQINLRVPGAHIKGEALPVLLRVAGVESQKTGPVLPVIAVE
jgi:uncharacterized protein (TIGR03437 family)